MTENQHNHYLRAIEFLEKAGEAAESGNPTIGDRMLMVSGVHARLAQSQALARIGDLLDERLAKADPKWKGIAEA